MLSSGRVMTNVHKGRSLFFMVAITSGVISLSPDEECATVSRMTCLGWYFFSTSATDSTTSMRRNMPIFTICGSISLKMASICPLTTLAGRSKKDWMPSVLCTVMLVIAVTACAPKRVMARMSACTPEPPVPSEPVMLKTVFIAVILLQINRSFRNYYKVHSDFGKQNAVFGKNGFSSMKKGRIFAVSISF